MQTSNGAKQVIKLSNIKLACSPIITVIILFKIMVIVTVMQ